MIFWDSKSLISFSFIQKCHIVKYEESSSFQSNIEPHFGLLRPILLDTTVKAIMFNPGTVGETLKICNWGSFFMTLVFLRDLSRAYHALWSKTHGFLSIVIWRLWDHRIRAYTQLNSWSNYSTFYGFWIYCLTFFIKYILKLILVLKIFINKTIQFLVSTPVLTDIILITFPFLLPVSCNKSAITISGKFIWNLWIFPSHFRRFMLHFSCT